MKRVRFWNIPVPRELDDRVEEWVRRDAHVSKAELIRDAVRRYLEMLEREAERSDRNRY